MTQPLDILRQPLGILRRQAAAIPGGRRAAARLLLLLLVVRGGALALFDFLVGDDWRTAAGVVVAVGLTALLAALGAAAWWVMPVSVALLLALSLHRFARRAP